MLKARRLCPNKSQVLCICGFVSCVTLFLLLFDQSWTRNVLSSTNETLKSVFSAKSDYTTLINLNFTFKILPLVCIDKEESLLVLVHSATDHFNNRKVIRETWGQHDDSIKLLFLVGVVENTAIQKQIEEESELNKDLLQGSFLDSYHNLTYKHVMALKYAVYHCPKTKFVLKVDDDTFVIMPAMKIFTTSYHCQKKKIRSILCIVSYYPPVLREGKWAASLEDYPENNYPIHCGGYAILYPNDIIYPLYITAQKTKYFWVDDVFVSGICAKISNITHVGIEKLVLSHEEVSSIIDKSFNDVNKAFLIAGYNLYENEIKALWNFSMLHKQKSLLDYLVYD